MHGTMNVSELEKKLMAAARAHRPTDAVPYAFEKRIMARLAGMPVADVWVLWTRAFWRVATPCLAVAFMACIYSVYLHPTLQPLPELDTELEATVLAGIESGGESW